MQKLKLGQEKNIQKSIKINNKVKCVPLYFLLQTILKSAEIIAIALFLIENFKTN